MRTIDIHELARRIRDDADILRIAAEAVADAADDLEAERVSVARAARVLDLSALNCAATALGLAKRGGLLDALSGDEGGGS